MSIITVKDFVNGWNSHKTMKTRKFTYEGSSKPIKIVYLVGLILFNYTNWLFVVLILLGMVNFGLFFTETGHFQWEIFFKFGIIFFVINTIGYYIIKIAQFMNWLDRGSINSEIFR